MVFIYFIHKEYKTIVIVHSFLAILIVTFHTTTVDSKKYRNLRLYEFYVLTSIANQQGGGFIGSLLHHYIFI